MPTHTYKSLPRALGHSLLHSPGTGTHQRCGELPQPRDHPTGVTLADGNEFFGPQDPPSSLKPMTECVLNLPPVASNQQWGQVLESERLVGFVALPLPLTSLVPAPVALVNVTLVHGLFDYTDIRAQWSSHCMVYQLFG